MQPSTSDTDMTGEKKVYADAQEFRIWVCDSDDAGSGDGGADCDRDDLGNGSRPERRADERSYGHGSKYSDGAGTADIDGREWRIYACGAALRSLQIENGEDRVSNSGCERHGGGGPGTHG